MGYQTYFLLAFFTFAFAFSQCQAQQHQSCTSLDLVASFKIGNETVLQWNATLRAEAGKKGADTKIFVEKIATTSKNSAMYHLVQNSKIKASINKGPEIECGSKSRASTSCWSTSNSTINLALPVVINGNSGDAPILEALIDEGSISESWGPIFQESNKCNQDGEEISALPNVQIQVEQCCSVFETVKPPPSSVPKCNRFRARSIIRNSDFSIFATVNTTITPNMMSLDVSSEYTGPSGSSFQISANGYYTMCGSHTDTTATCSFPLVMGDSKYLFLLQISGSDFSYPLSAGRLVIRNQELLMEEGVGFTSGNDCFYTSVKYDDSKMGTTELCCKEFA